MLITGLAVGVVISALITIRAAYSLRRRWFYLFKPLTTILILVMALASPILAGNSYAFWVVAGLAFSLAGDVFLMLSDKRFIWGLISFLAAHFTYIVAFTLRAGFRESPWISVPFIIAALVILAQIAPRARGLRWPVTVYGLALLAMAWRACAAWAILRSLPAFLAALGALIFVVSDTSLGVNRFVRRFRWAQVVVLGTYYTAQALIAWSTWPAPWLVFRAASP
jgi:uncharacterized membrane protein YhhN